MTEIYFDNSSTTRVCEEAAEAALNAMRREYGNPSSAHSLGAAADRALKEARAAIAAVMGVPAEEVFFNSCGSEGNNTALLGAALAGGKERRRLLISAVEHPSVTEPAKWLAGRGYELSLIPVDSCGVVDTEALRGLLDERVALVSVMQVNNETGAVQPLPEIGRAVRELAPEAMFHVDAVQAFGRLPMELAEWRADAATVSGHKLHAPKGVGALWLRSSRHLQPLIHGGGQERKFRSGTENMPGILAFAAAANIAGAGREEFAARMLSVKNALREALLNRVEDCFVNGPDGEGAAPHILNMSFIGARSETLLHYLEQQSVFVSAGSACTSRSSKGSGILTAMGLKPERVDSALRFSFSRFNTVEEAEEAAHIIAGAVAEIRSFTHWKKPKK